MRILCDDGSNDDELFVFDHDSDAWIWQLEQIKSREEAGDEVLGDGAGEGGDLIGDGFMYYISDF
jgi:hypothetical protein